MPLTGRGGSNPPSDTCNAIRQQTAAATTLEMAPLPSSLEPRLLSSALAETRVLSTSYPVTSPAR